MKHTVHNSLLRVLTVALLLSAFSTAWAHVHPANRETESHPCLLCQWVKAPVSVPTVHVVPVVFEVYECLWLPCTLEAVPPFRTLLRSRSPPPVSFS